MDVKKHVLSEQVSPKGKAISRLGWVLVASLIFITGLFLNNSLQSPFVGSLFQPSSTYSSLNSSSSSSSADSVVVPFGHNNNNYYGIINATTDEDLQKKHEDTEHDKIETNGNNASNKVAEIQDFLETAEGDNVDLEDGVDVENVAVGGENVNNGTLIAENVNNNSNNYNNNGVAVVGGEFVDNVTTVNNNAEVVGLSAGEEKNKAMENKQTEDNEDSFETCDLFDGRWVYDERSKPYYRPGSCPYLDIGFECQRNGRPDTDYIKWKWHPNGCDLPRLNATDFLERLRGKRLVFIGDSLNRNMWESLVCILRGSIKNKKRVYEISGRHDFKKKGIYSFRFEDYNCSVDSVAAPFLVKESTFKRENGSIQTLRLDVMDPATSMYHDADFMVFNTGHWWTHEKTSKGEDYYQEGDYVYPRLSYLKAFRKALKTWSRWLDKNVDSSRTQVFFRGYSVAHFWGGQWNSGGKCHQETEPITNETFLTKYPAKMRALERVLQYTKTPVTYLNISRLTDYRKDAHPSIYRKQYKTEEEKNAAVKVQDCSHWCLPGVPDTWNELLYASLLKSAKGIWRN